MSLQIPAYRRGCLREVEGANADRGRDCILPPYVLFQTHMVVMCGCPEYLLIALCAIDDCLGSWRIFQKLGIDQDLLEMTEVTFTEELGT
jgi:hypothetical protein